jgi:protocatechuate 3,4-dioxygenase beta subunit
MREEPVVIHDRQWSRRDFLRAAMRLPAILLFGNALPARVRAQTTAPTPACKEPDDPTPAQTAGPFYKPRSPQRSSLIESGMTGTKILLRGYVRSTRCKPVSGALLELWQADAAGVYDNTGYKLRGHQFADASGRYTFETIVPGLYPGRTRHFHVRVQAPNRQILTTQLYFPDEPQNRRDGIFNEKLLMTLSQNGSERLAAFDFALDLT